MTLETRGKQNPQKCQTCRWRLKSQFDVLSVETRQGMWKLRPNDKSLPKNSVDLRLIKRRLAKQATSCSQTPKQVSSRLSSKCRAAPNQVPNRAPAFQERVVRETKAEN